MSDKREIRVHVHQHLGIEGRLVAYELVGPTGKLNVINVHVLFGDATDRFLEHLMEAYRQLAMIGPTISIDERQWRPHNGRPRSATDTGGHSHQDGHAALGPAGPHDLPKRPGLAAAPAAGCNRFMHQPLICRSNTSGGNRDTVPRLTFQGH